MELEELEKWHNSIIENRAIKDSELVKVGNDIILVCNGDFATPILKNSSAHKLAVKYILEETDEETKLLFKKLIESLDETTISDKR